MLLFMEADLSSTAQKWSFQKSVRAWSSVFCRRGRDNLWYVRLLADYARTRVVDACHASAHSRFFVEERPGHHVKLYEYSSARDIRDIVSRHVRVRCYQQRKSAY